MGPDRDFNDRAFALRYAEKHQNMARNFGEEYTRKMAARGFRQGKILDAGCGFGGTLITVLKTFPTAEGVGIDMSEPLLELARQTAEAENVSERVTFEEGDVQEMPYPDDSFDVVISTNVLHHVAAPLVMVNELERVLAPGGMLFIADIRRSRLGGLFDSAFREAMPVGVIEDLFRQSNLTEKGFTTGMLWWRYER
jgi:ubiquinone/menaquinone biosynthesis C-methylase UbiE